MSARIGYHPSISNGIEYMIQNCLNSGCTCCQCFLGSPKSFSAEILDKDFCNDIKDIVKKNNFFFIAHSPYLLNFARDLIEEDKKFHLKRYVTDLINIDQLGGIGSVLHMGSSLKMGHNKSCENFIKNLEWVVDRIPDSVTILLENMSGKGTNMCCDLESWTDFDSRLPEHLKNRTKWVVDTCHLYANGEFDLSSRRESQRFYREFDKNIGWDRIACFHFNGSIGSFGSKIDNHADICNDNCGKIETKGLRQLARIAFDTNKPLILETPGEETDIIEQVELIKTWEKR